MSALASTLSAAEWDNNFDLGTTLTKGNSESLLFTAGISSEYMGKTDEYLINLFYTYGESDEDTTNDELRANASWKHLLDRKSYSGLRYDFIRDDVSDINYRTSLTGVYGYYLIKNDITKLSMEGGLGYTLEEQGSIDDNYANLYLGEFFEHKLNGNTKIFQSFTIFTPIDDFDNYNFILEAGIQTTLTETLSLKVSIQNKYDAVPAFDRDSNDFKFVTGISYNF